MEFCVLGPLLVRDGSGVRVVPAAKQRVLLAALLLRPGQVVPADVLADTIWNFAPPPSAATTLRNYVMRLRRGLGEAGERIGTGEGGYLIEVEPGELDIHRFDALRAQGVAALREGECEQAAGLLRAALGLWRGPALADVPSDLLHQSEADRLNEGRLDVVEARVEAELRLDRHPAVVAELRALTAEHPGRERLWAQLMTALYRSGRRTEALNVYQQVRRTLVDEIGVEPGADIREVHQVILRDEPVVPRRAAPAIVAGPDGPTGPAAPHRAAGVKGSAAIGENAAGREFTGGGESQGGLAPEDRAIPVVPFQLPPDIADFTGRETEIRRISEALVQERGCPAVIAVSGQPGVGKSALAVRSAHLAASAFPDGVLYAELGGTGTAVDPRAVLASFLLAVGVAADALPAETGARAALYRSVLAGRRMLVVLDDARDGAQVRHLMPADPAAAVLITSRGLLADVAGARQVGLGLPAEPEARLMFGRIIGPERAAADPRAAADVVAACGRLPLAVRAGAARLVARPAWSVRDLADRLSEGGRPLDELRIGGLDVRDSIARSHDALDPDEARAFRLLAWSDAPVITLAAAAAALGEATARAEELLDRLVDAHLLAAPAPGRYGYHPLLRSFAREQSLLDDPARLRARAMTCSTVTGRAATAGYPAEASAALAGRMSTAPRVPAQRHPGSGCPTCAPVDVRAA
ncbi:BTAD domain-containing putative transcriptional regulator [Kitasatospora sp. MBT63]|uniref:AfsR/SARP family transcriptional regulator n=1 Tax=Kitasatospora sp. MBT63 TaxID=1444768 RepID=UPI00069223F8|nr:BTAD domain-containing putative transcriptional regulator [Kitasatospora sp. MBT63]